MEYVAQTIKVLRDLVDAERSERCPNTGFLRRIPYSNSIFWRDEGPLGISLRILYFNLCKHVTCIN